jgi:hypothetical protein
MNEAIATVREFLDAELAAGQAMFRAPDDAAWRQAADHASAFLGPALTLGFERPPDGMPEATRGYGDELVARVLFAVTRHEGADGRTVFRAFVGDTRDPDGLLYGQALHLAEVDGALKIVGRAGASPFEESGVLRWEPLGGDQLEDAGPPVEVSLFQRPVEEGAAAHYDALEASA